MSTDAETIRTAFDDVQRELGGEFMDWEGWYWPTDFGDAVAEHNAVRQDVGVWDESPLRKWDFTGPDALAAADRIFTNDMLGLEIGQVRYAPFCDENGKMVGDGTVFKFTRLERLGDHGARLRPRPHARGRRRARRRDRADHGEAPARPAPGPALARAARRSRRRGRREPPLLPLPARTRCTSAASRAGSRAPATPASSATSSSPSRTTPRSSGASSTEAGAKPYGLSAVETLRIESGLIFIGYDYFQHETDPFDMSPRQGDPPRHGRLLRQGRARGRRRRARRSGSSRSSSTAPTCPSTAPP